MKISKIDLHIHSKYAYRCSKKLEFKNILARAKSVGLTAIGTGDILHTQWREEVKKYFSNCELVLFLTTELCVKGIHYLLIFPNMDTVQKTYLVLKPLSKDIDKNGRCNVHIEIDNLIIYCKENNILIGLAHAFTPCGYYYKHKQLLNLDFIECGIGFKLEWANMINPGSNLIVCSDAHSLQSIGRAYIEINTTVMNYDELCNIFKKKPTYTLVSGIAEINRHYNNAKERIKPILNDFKKINNEGYTYRVELTKEEVIINLYNTNKYSKKFLQLYESMPLKIYNKYKFAEHINIILEGKNGKPGKFIFVY